MNLLSERLLWAMQQEQKRRNGKRVTKAELARAAGVSDTAAGNWLKGDHGIDAPRARALAAHLSVDPLWLETGEGPMTPQLQVVAAPDSPFVELPGQVADARPVRAGENSDTVAVPRVKLRLRAGVANYDTEPDMDGDGHELVPRELLATLGVKAANLLAVRVRGTSMEPMLFEDDVVIIDKSDTKPISREVYAVNFDGDACVKQLLFKGGQWYLHSLNSDHKPVNVKSGQCSIVGRVVIQPTRILTGRL